MNILFRRLVTGFLISDLIVVTFFVSRVSRISDFLCLETTCLVKIEKIAYKSRLVF